MEQTKKLILYYTEPFFLDIKVLDKLSTCSFFNQN